MDEVCQAALGLFQQVQVRDLRGAVFWRHGGKMRPRGCAHTRGGWVDWCGGLVGVVGGWCGWWLVWLVVGVVGVVCVGGSLRRG